MSLEAQRAAPTGDIALVDLLDRLLGTGVVLAGDVVISLAGVDLVRVQIQALVTSVKQERSAVTATREASHGA